MHPVMCGASVPRIVADRRAAAIRVPLPHTLELNAAPSTPTPARSCTPTGPGRRRRWTTPRSAG
ncbi:linear gramicidin synthetase subunit C domain protein [Mycobacterium xenopi 4042]|uniref:Linear gramicidin synthetase subunit C domain protein n=1 Tax=Mycobacterium xenopi 4042 TaxID=1299334 RepID=X8E6K1_MYCXE|nr:linear gramicidin synthetase subunit C domain protein [Mycobacterium xenopi 4042]